MSHDVLTRSSRQTRSALMAVGIAIAALEYGVVNVSNEISLTYVNITISPDRLLQALAIALIYFATSFVFCIYHDWKHRENSPIVDRLATIRKEIELNAERHQRLLSQQEQERAAQGSNTNYDDFEISEGIRAYEIEELNHYKQAAKVSNETEQAGRVELIKFIVIDIVPAAVIFVMASMALLTDAST